MADSFTSDGLTVATNSELVSQLETDFREIYGSDINLDQNSPDGQLLNIFAQGGTDIRELLMQLYTSFDPDNASGSVLDARCALNNVTRRAGTFTTVNITIVTDRTVTLSGVDENYNDPNAAGYTIQDNAGNQFVLANTQTLTAGTNTNILFRAKELGAVETTVGTITTPVTIVLGVISVNNPVASTTGINEETDSQLKIRRRQSVAISSTGYLNGIEAALRQLTGVTDARVYENNGNTTDIYGTPEHCIWCVVEGGSSADIADIIYKKRSGGCDLRGALTYTIITPSSQSFVAKWDTPLSQSMYIKFNIQKATPTATFDLDAISDYISSHLSYSIGESANTADITTIAQQGIDANGGNGYAVNVLISTGGTSSVSVSGTGITAATVDNTTFQSAVSDVAATYTFSFDGTDWKLSGDVVDLDDYGITLTGTAVNGDSVAVVWTASSWVEYIAPIIATKLAVTGVYPTVI